MILSYISSACKMSQVSFLDRKASVVETEQINIDVLGANMRTILIFPLVGKYFVWVISKKNSRSNLSAFSQFKESNRKNQRYSILHVTSYWIKNSNLR